MAQVLYSLDSKVDSVVSMASRACDTSDVWETLAQVWIPLPLDSRQATCQCACVLVIRVTTLLK